MESNLLKAHKWMIRFFQAQQKQKTARVHVVYGRSVCKKSTWERQAIVEN